MVGQNSGGDKRSPADAGYLRRRQFLYGGRQAARWVTDGRSCRRPDFRQVAKVSLIRRYAVEAAVWQAGVILGKELCQSCLGLRDNRYGERGQVNRSSLCPAFRGHLPLPTTLALDA